MKVYIAMPINGASYDHQQMFRDVGEIVRSYGLEPILPSEDVGRERWVSWLEDGRFADACTRLVQSDLGNLKRADAILAILPTASIGTAMEICYASYWHKTVVVVVTLSMLYHPWIWHHADRVVWSDDPFGEGVHRAAAYLQQIETAAK